MRARQRTGERQLLYSRVEATSSLLLIKIQGLLLLHLLLPSPPPLVFFLFCTSSTSFLLLYHHHLLLLFFLFLLAGCLFYLPFVWLSILTSIGKTATWSFHPQYYATNHPCDGGKQCIHHGDQRIQSRVINLSLHGWITQIWQDHELLHWSHGNNWELQCGKALV